MSRFELYGGNRCEKCHWYTPASQDSASTPRCYHPSNTHLIWCGQAFFKRPEAINWNLRCEDYKEEEERNGKNKPRNKRG